MFGSALVGVEAQLAHADAPAGVRSRNRCCGFNVPPSSANWDGVDAMAAGHGAASAGATAGGRAEEGPYVGDVLLTGGLESSGELVDDDGIQKLHMRHAVKELWRVSLEVWLETCLRWPIELLNSHSTLVTCRAPTPRQFTDGAK